MYSTACHRQKCGTKHNPEKPSGQNQPTHAQKKKLLNYQNLKFTDQKNKLSMDFSQSASWWSYKAKCIIHFWQTHVIGLSPSLSVNQMQCAVHGELWTACCRKHKHTHTLADGRCCGRSQSGMSQHQTVGNTARKLWNTWTGLIWLRIAACSRLLHTWWSVVFYKMWGVRWLVKELSASVQHGLKPSVSRLPIIRYVLSFHCIYCTSLVLVHTQTHNTHLAFLHNTKYFFESLYYNSGTLTARSCRIFS
jgi:hypothetical protein